jgi:hypothetical protein
MATTTQVLSTIPDAVDVHHYGGDTLPLLIECPASYVAGRDWNAQVRSSRDAAEVDATFVVTAGATADETYLTLPGAVVAELLATKGVQVRVDGKLILRYTGVWDAQVSDGGLDPISTVAQGALIIDQDVTRLP